MAKQPGYTREQLEGGSLRPEPEQAARALARLFSVKALRNSAYAIGRRASGAQQQAEKLGFRSERGSEVFMSAEELRLMARIFDRARVLKESPAGKELYDA